MTGRTPPPGPAEDRLHGLESGSGQGYAEILDAILDAVLAVDQQGRIVFANQPSERMFGYPRSELLGKPVEVLVPGPERAGHVALRLKYAQAPVARRMGAHVDLYGVRRDGSTFPAEVSLAWLDTAGGPVVTAVVRDLTLQRRHAESEETARQLEQALRVSNERFTLAFDQAPIAMMMISARRGHEGTVIRVNDAVCALTGRAAADLLGRQGREVFLRDGETGDPSGLGAEILTGRRSTVDGVERRVEHTDGHSIWVSITAAAVRDDHGRPDYLFVSQILDVTERRRAEREARRRNARDRRIATVLQQGLLPYVPRRIGNVRIASRYQPAGATAGEAIGGDWHDVFVLPDGTLGITVGDVAGHGVDSAVTMTRLRYAARMLATGGADPALVVNRLNQLMHDADRPVDDIEIATVVQAKLDLYRNVLTYCSAGHLPLIVLARSTTTPARGDDGLRRDPAGPPVARSVPALGGPPIGVVAGHRYTEHRSRFDTDGVLIGFTDGLVERRHQSIDQGLETLLNGLNALSATGVTDVEQLADAVLELAPAGPRTDDTAVIVLAAHPWPTADEPPHTGTSG